MSHQQVVLVLRAQVASVTNVEPDPSLSVHVLPGHVQVELLAVSNLPTAQSNSAQPEYDVLTLLIKNPVTRKALSPGHGYMITFTEVPA